MSKKAQQSELKNIILILIVGAILLTFVGGTLLKWQEMFSKEKACQMSILASAKSQKEIAGTKVGPTFDFNCEVEEKEITYDKFKNSDGTINSMKVKGELAKQMYKCWSMVGEGKLDPFKDWEGDPTYCLVCSNINFDNDFINKSGEDYNAPGAPLKDFVYYLGTEYIPGTNFTFYNYLYGTETNEVTPEIQSELANLESIDYHQQYSLLYRAEIDGHSPWKIWAAVGYGGVVGAVTYYLSDGRKAMMGIYLIPTELIDSKITEGENEGERFCEILVN